MSTPIPNGPKPPVKFAVGVVHGQEIDGWFLKSLTDLMSSREKAPIPWEDMLLIRSGPLLAAGRGVLVGQFLEHSDAEILVMLDADMHFEAGRVYELVDMLSKAREQDPKIAAVGGLAFISNHPHAFAPVPNLWIAHPEIPREYLHLQTFPENSLMEIGATGGACIAIHREPLEYFREERINPFHHICKVDWTLLARSAMKYTDEAELAEYIRQQVWDADQFGEDLSFCARLREAGYRILAHTGIIFDHSKAMLLGKQHYDMAHHA